MPRKKTFQVMREAGKVGAYDDMPMLPEDLQVQVHLSRNDRPQPFHQLFANDTLLFLMSGGGLVEMRNSPVERFTLTPGDCVYVPAGVPHRLLPAEESVVLRYKPHPPGIEGVAWYCDNCGAELHRDIWHADRVASQAMFHEMSTRFAADTDRRTCATCGTVLPAPDLVGFRWRDVARELGGSASAVIA
jgi:mannose-6-phosphate isomerase-like protein (cupin superfamily)